MHYPAYVTLIAVSFIVLGIWVILYLFDRAKVIRYFKPYIGEDRAKRIELADCSLWLHERLTDITHTRKGVTHYELGRSMLYQFNDRTEAVNTCVQIIHYLRPYRFKGLDIAWWESRDVLIYIHHHFHGLNRTDILRICLWALVLNPESDRALQEL